MKLKNYLGLTLAGIINAFGVTCFLVPLSIYDSGISGTSMLISSKTPNYISLSLILILLNFPIFFYGLKKQGKVFTIYSLYTVLIYSVMAYCFNKWFEGYNGSPIAKDDKFLCAIFGGIISGIGSGLTIRFGGAIDGIDVLSVIFAKNIGISVGTFVMGFNAILYIICGIVNKDYIVPLYSIVTYMVGLRAVDFMVYGLNKSKCAMIVTNNPDKVIENLIEQFSSGPTKVEAYGGFSKQKKYILYFIVNRFQVTKMKRIVYENDPLAFISLSEVTDIFKYNKIEKKS